MGNNRMRTNPLKFSRGTEGLLHEGNCSAVLVTALNPVTSSFRGSSCSWGAHPDQGPSTGSARLIWKRPILFVPWLCDLIN